MKKLILLICVLFFVTSCLGNENVQNKTVEGNVNVVKDKKIEDFEEKISEKYNKNEKVEVVENSVKEELKKEDDVETLELDFEKERLKKLEERKTILDESFKHYSTLGINSQANLNCEELYPVKSNMNNEEKKLAIETTSKCKKIREKARKQLEKEKGAFNISFCEKSINERYKQREEYEKTQDLEKGIKLPSKEEQEQFKQTEIEICEIGFALQKNNCDLIFDEVKKNKCEKFRNLLNEQRELEAIKNFKLEDYIK